MRSNPQMLLRIAQGDAYGLATEYTSDSFTLAKAIQFRQYVKHPTHSLRAGEYSDDTQMSIAVTEVLLEKDPKSLKAEDFADAFVRCFKRDERDGYARGFQALLEEVRDGAELLAKVHPDSDKNGAAMRSVPLGVLPTPELVIKVARLQAAITHNTPGGIRSAVLVGLMSHFALHVDRPLYQLRPWLKELLPDEPLPIWSGARVKGPNVGLNTAHAVLSLLMEQGSLITVAKEALLWGGDTDSVLSIAWGIGSARMRERLPLFFDRDLEPGSRYGRHFLLDLGMRLMSKYSR